MNNTKTEQVGFSDHTWITAELGEIRIEYPLQLYRQVDVRKAMINRNVVDLYAKGDYPIQNSFTLVSKFVKPFPLTHLIKKVDYIDYKTTVSEFRDYNQT